MLGGNTPDIKTDNTMEKNNTPFRQILSEVVGQIKNDITNKEKCDMCIVDMVLNAHNSYFGHESKEPDKVIYDINNQTDVQTCVNKGMGAASIALIWRQWQTEHSQYFLYDTEKGEITLLDWDEFIQMLTDNLEEVVGAILSRPFIMDSYRDLYVHYIMPMVMDQL